MTINKSIVKQILTISIFVITFFNSSISVSQNQTSAELFNQIMNFDNLNNDIGGTVEDEISINKIDKDLIKLVNLEYKKKSTVEKIYFSSTDKNLQLKGYDFFLTQMFFWNNSKRFNNGGLQENKVLNIGDEIIITLQGPKNNILKKRVDSNGFIFIDYLGLISAKGRRFDEVKNEIESRVETNLLETKAYVSLGKLFLKSCRPTICK